jgi:pimeloyl-ACP methyl ester carboxylesterase
MALFVLVPGAGGMAWYWHRVVPLIQAAGHEALAVDLPGEDRCAGLATYAEIVVDAIAERSDVILVAQSLAGFTAPLVCARAPVRTLVFVNAMIPKTGESAGAWWDAKSEALGQVRLAIRRASADAGLTKKPASRPVHSPQTTMLLPRVQNKVRNEFCNSIPQTPEGRFQWRKRRSGPLPE